MHETDMELIEPTVYISKHSLNYFRKRARNDPYEIHAYLIGEIYYPNQIVVSSVEHTKDYTYQAKDCVQPSGEDFHRAKMLAVQQGKRIVGDLHSHPNYDPVMSPADYQAAMEDGCHVVGIVGIRKNKTKVLFWLAGSSLPCEISYEAFTVPKV